MYVKFGRAAANPQVQLLPGPITPHNENPSLSRSREAHRKRTRELGLCMGKWRQADGRMDGWTAGLAALAAEWTDGWMDGRWGSLRSLRNGRTDGRMDGWTVGLAPLAAEWTDGWTDGRWGSLRSLRNGRTDGRMAVSYTHLRAHET